MPLHTHVGSAVPDYGDLPGANALFAMESPFFSHRPFWFLIWGGVFENHPDLTMVFAEQGSDWVPDTLQMMDNMYDRMFRHEQKRLKSRPSEYWQRQCYVQAMFFRASEAKLRHKIGVEQHAVGLRLPALRGQLAQQPQGDPRGAARRARARDPRDPRRRTRRVCTGSTSRCSTDRGARRTRPRRDLRSTRSTTSSKFGAYWRPFAAAWRRQTTSTAGAANCAL